MTQGELDCLKESCSFSIGIQIRLPEVDKTIMSTRPGKVAFYEAAFQAGLHLSIHLTIRRILQYYNIYPAQLVPNAWQRIVCTVVLWRFHKFTLSLNKFSNLFGPYNNLKPDSGWLFFKARPKKTLLGGQMASNGEDNANYKLTGSAAHVAGDEAMSKKINLNKLAQMAKGEPKSTTLAAKGIVIDEKRQWDEMPDISPSKKGKQAVNAKRKGPMPPPEDKKKALTKSKAMPTAAVPREGTSTNPGVVLGYNISMIGNPVVAKKLLKGVIPLADKEEVEKLDLDWAISKFFHCAWATSVGSEMAHAQQWATDLEGQVANLGAREQHANEELGRMKEPPS
ncbi:hypothetical protein Acr_00g0086320 [Actinidia rufa]|uniref:Uncharacterized protein n=1 Tax=Actinidia rufa TaxID=165716 RepID=A0A7J0DY93_9ERIC|nr:hypothetical protein Acr_00g0086320 [Actinidia rufa]